MTKKEEFFRAIHNNIMYYDIFTITFIDTNTEDVIESTFKVKHYDIEKEEGITFYDYLKITFDSVLNDNLESIEDPHCKIIDYKFWDEITLGGKLL